MRSLLAIVALIGLWVGLWSQPVSRAWIYHGLGREHDAWLAAIQAPRSVARDRVLVGALAAIVDADDAADEERQAALRTLSCLAPESLLVLPALVRALETEQPKARGTASWPLRELARVDLQATLILFASDHQRPYWHETLQALQPDSSPSDELLQAALLHGLREPEPDLSALLPLLEWLCRTGGVTDQLAQPLAELAIPEDHWDVDSHPYEMLAMLKEGAAPALPALVQALDEVSGQRAKLGAALTSIGAPAHGAAPAYFASLADTVAFWDAIDVDAYVALAPSPAAAVPALRQATALESLELRTRLQAAEALHATDAAAPEPRALAIEILTSQDPHFRDPWWRGAAEVEATIARALDLLQPAPAGDSLAALLPAVAAVCRAPLLVRAAAQAPGDEHLRALFHDELHSPACPERELQAMRWILQIGPDEAALDLLRGLAERLRPAPRLGLTRTPPRKPRVLASRTVAQQICPASRAAVRKLALEWLESGVLDLEYDGAIMLANLEPEHPALLSWLAEELTLGQGESSFDSALGIDEWDLAAWLGPHARSLTPQLFGMLLTGGGQFTVAETLRHIEQRPGWERHQEPDR